MSNSTSPKKNYFILSLFWLIEQYTKQPCRNNFFGPPDKKTNPSQFLIKGEKGKRQDQFFIPLNTFMDIHSSQKKTLFDSVNLDIDIKTCIFVVPEALEPRQREQLQAIFPQKIVNIWDDEKLTHLFSRYLEQPIDKVKRSSFLDIMRKIDFFTIINSHAGTPETDYGKRLINLLPRFSLDMCQKILDTAESLAVDDLFKQNKYAKVEAVVLCGDITRFTRIMEYATTHPVIKSDPAIFGELMQKWYSETYDIVMQHNGFLDKFMGDGFLALFDYPFADNTTKGILEAYHCAAELIQCTQTMICDDIIKSYFPELYNTKEQIGSLRCGISVGMIYTAPTSTLTHEIYQNFFIVSDAVIEATRIQSATSPQTIGIATQQYKQLPTDFKQATDITKTTKVKKQAIHYTQCSASRIFK